LCKDQFLPVVDVPLDTRWSDLTQAHIIGAATASRIGYQIVAVRPGWIPHASSVRSAGISETQKISREVWSNFARKFISSSVG
jgi:hypothetical protein